jgi:flagellar motor switch protein FliN/FliY
MTDGMTLSQDEINALLGNIEEEMNNEHTLSEEEIDAIGEIGNISMGTAATTLFSLLNHKVLITTPKVEVLSQEDFKRLLEEDIIGVSVNYTAGLTGANVLFLSERDVRVITDLMMGGSGDPREEELSEFHLSAIAEAMNQMVGSSSTSMSQMFAKKVDISPPQALLSKNDLENLEDLFSNDEFLVKISFRIQVLDNIIDSELMQIIPMHLAKELVHNLLDQAMTGDDIMPESSDTQQSLEKTETEQLMMPSADSGSSIAQNTASVANSNFTSQPSMRTQPRVEKARNVEAQNIEFPNFERVPVAYPKENMNVLMDVPLEVSVELGRSHKRIKEILELGPGSIIELNKLVGEPVDILVNGKFIAKGEVVVIDENFGVRITDIISSENRI